MGGYLLLYPRAKLRIHIRAIILPFSMRLPDWFYLGAWFFGLQVLYAYLNIPGVAWYAHIGVFLFGFMVLAGLKKFAYL
jgi:membrane associated rhomboid family serine protease